MKADQGKEYSRTHEHTACHRTPVRSGVCGELLRRARFMLVVRGVSGISGGSFFHSKCVYMFLFFLFCPRETHPGVDKTQTPPAEAGFCSAVEQK